MAPLALAVFTIHEGAQAADAGAPSTACPYDRSRPYSRPGWIVGWTGARRRAGKPLASDFIDEELADLDEDEDGHHAAGSSRRPASTPGSRRRRRDRGQHPRKPGPCCAASKVPSSPSEPSPTADFLNSLTQPHPCGKVES